MPYAIYLRKSRADGTAGSPIDMSDTLSRHRDALLELAERRKLEIGGIYEELASGETLAARPQMQQLLAEVERGQWEGVLVMELERLARGNSIDQGRILQAFQYSGTQIITPAKVYNPASACDEEYVEFGLFLSRREYKTIQRRMLAGRVASVREGKYMGKTNPYGYCRVKIPHAKGYTLQPHPTQSFIVQEIFSLRLEGMNCRAIARHLNAKGERTNRGNPWSGQAVTQILRNRLYAGYVTWGRKPCYAQIRQGVVVHSRRYSQTYLSQKGLHPALISESDFDAVQRLLDTAPQVPLRRDKPLRNPFAGLLVCAQCGHCMSYVATAHTPPFAGRLRCRNPRCRMGNGGEDSVRDDVRDDLRDGIRDSVRDNGRKDERNSRSSIPCRLLEEALLETLRPWLSEYTVNLQEQVQQQYQAQREQGERERQALQTAQRRLQRQQNTAAELTEQGIYTPADFVARRQQLRTQQQRLEAELASLQTRQRQRQTEWESIRSAIASAPAGEATVLTAYQAATSAAQKNALLKTFLTRITCRQVASTQAGTPVVWQLDITRKFD